MTTIDPYGDGGASRRAGIVRTTVANDPGYTVRGWRTVATGHHVVTVVDRKGAIVHVTIPHRYADAGHADTIIRHALAHRTPHPPAPS